MRVFNVCMLVFFFLLYNCINRNWSGIGVGWMFGTAGSIHTLLGLLTFCLLLYFVEYVVPPDVIFRSVSLEAWVLLETSGVRISIFKRVCRAGIVTVPTPTTRNDEPVQYCSVPARGPKIAPAR